jgi:hypothetical protein
LQKSRASRPAGTKLTVLARPIADDAVIVQATQARRVRTIREETGACQ